MSDKMREALEALGIIESVIKVRQSQYDAVCRERDELAAQVERLSGQLRASRKWIEKQEVDAFGVVEETHDCPAYPIRDELIYEITKTINETPAQSLSAVSDGTKTLLEDINDFLCDVPHPNDGGDPDALALRERVDAALAAPEAEEPSIYEDVYEQITDLIEPHVIRQGGNSEAFLPASAVESVSKLLDMAIAYRKQAGEPVAWLRYRNVLIAPDDAIEGFEVCEPNEHGDDGSPAFPVYDHAQPQPDWVPEEMTIQKAVNKAFEGQEDGYVHGFNTCRNQVLSRLTRPQPPEGGS